MGKRMHTIGSLLEVGYSEYPTSNSGTSRQKKSQKILLTSFCHLFNVYITRVISPEQWLYICSTKHCIAVAFSNNHVAHTKRSDLEAFVVVVVAVVVVVVSGAVMITCEWRCCLIGSTLTNSPRRRLSNSVSETEKANFLVADRGF